MHQPLVYARAVQVAVGDRKGAGDFYIVLDRLVALIEILISLLRNKAAGITVVHMFSDTPALAVIMVAHHDVIDRVVRLDQAVLTLRWLCHAHVYCVNRIIGIVPAATR